MSSFSLFDFLKVTFKLKPGVSGVSSVFLQHYQTSIVCFTHIQLFLLWKKINCCKLRVSSLRRFAFATLRWPHFVRRDLPPTYFAQATRLRHAITVLTCPTSSPFPELRSHDHPNHLLSIRVNGFVRFCTLRHRFPPDGPPLLNVNLTLKESGILSLHVKYPAKWKTNRGETKWVLEPFKTTQQTDLHPTAPAFFAWYEFSQVIRDRHLWTNRHAYT